tara:strand:- start:2010 stop:2669 length:660 start_codon:yes stop_codon:yes gene_type:complete
MNLFYLQIISFTLVALITSTNAQENLNFEIPTYKDFLELFPDGYPKYNNEIGNPMSIGAYELYLKELGYSSVSQSGNKVGIKIIVDGYNLTEGNDEKVNKKIEQKTKNKKQNKDNIDKTNIPLVELESWGSEIQKTIKDYLIYPPKAISRKQTGQVILSISLSNKGKIINAKIEKSSGFQSLDQGVMMTVNSLNYLTPKIILEPKKTYTFILPINFSLN